MKINLGQNELLARVCSDFRIGLPIILHNTNTALLIVAAETCPQSRIVDFMKAEPVLVLTRRRAESLKARCYDGDIARIKLPTDSNYHWIQAMIDPSRDLDYPMKGPIQTLRGGSAALHRIAVKLARRSRLLPAVLVQEIPYPIDTDIFRDITQIDHEHAQEAETGPLSIRLITSAHLPILATATARISVYRGIADDEEHCAIEIGSPLQSNPVITRLHSACFTGDVLNSLKCDCGPQLKMAIQIMADYGGGVLLYMNQEGRGIGLTNKVRAYSLQDQGFDTVEANHRLGFEDDERDFRFAASMLRNLGYKSVRLITNNPKKVQAMESQGLIVTERIPILVDRTRYNTNYLATKAKKSGHLM